MPDKPFVAGVQNGFQRSARRENPAGVIQRSNAVELIKVKPVGLHFSERAFQLAARLCGGALAGFTGEKNPVAVRLERRPQPVFGVAVGRRNVKVVDAAINGFADISCGFFPSGIHNHDSAEADN